MFTGIIETTGTIVTVDSKGSNHSFWITSPISKELRVDQSISHNGVCLTVEEVNGNRHRVTAIQETLEKTTLGQWRINDMVNLERCLPANGRFDGHFVQGHVDTTATCIDARDLNGSREFRVEFSPRFATLVVEKGSIALNGISLTIFNVTQNQFTVAIIPYTLQHTSMGLLTIGDKVNLEFDIIGKYVVRNAEVKKPVT